MVWLIDERRLALFPAGTIVKDPHHRESLTRRAGFEPAQNLSSGLVERSCAVAITTTPQRHLKNLKIEKFSVYYAEAIIYLMLYNLYDCAFNVFTIGLLHTAYSLQKLQGTLSQRSETFLICQSL